MTDITSRTPNAIHLCGPTAAQHEEMITDLAYDLRVCARFATGTRLTPDEARAIADVLANQRGWVR